MPGPDKQIERFRRGSRRTPLIASVMNDVVDALNVILRVQEGPGIKIFKADGNWIIATKAALEGQTETPTDGGGSGTLNWKGEWDAGENYVVGDVVIRKTDSDIEDGWKAGTYVCLKDTDDGSPAPSDPPDLEYWDLFSKGYWKRLVFRDDSDPTTNYSDIDAGSASHSHEVVIGGVGEEGSVEIRAADCQGRVLSIYEDEVCVDGESYYMLHIRSPFYRK